MLMMVNTLSLPTRSYSTSMHFVSSIACLFVFLVAGYGTINWWILDEIHREGTYFYNDPWMLRFWLPVSLLDWMDDRHPLRKSLNVWFSTLWLASAVLPTTLWPDAYHDHGSGMSLYTQVCYIYLMNLVATLVDNLGV